MATFGYTTVGGSSGTGAADRIYPTKFTLSEDGDVLSITWYGNKAAGGGSTKAYKFPIFADDGTGGTTAIEGATLLGVTNEINVSATEQWWTADFASPISLSAGDYWIAFISEFGSKFFFDSGATNQSYNASDTYSDGVADPCPSGGGYHAWDLSIYATYTASGGVSGVIINPFQGPNLGADLYNGALIV